MTKILKISAEDMVIDKYYSEVYSKYLNDKCLINIANRPLQIMIEKQSNKKDKNVLEIGGGRQAI